MTKDEKKESAWKQVYEDVKESRDSNGTLPDPKKYEDLTKSAGSK